MKGEIRITTKQLPDGRWAAFASRLSYYVNTISPTEREARINRLRDIGIEAQARIDAVDRALEKLGALDNSDPHGYLA